eukprot:TRINITY_DN1880_c0_g1_i2.p1 TRINITY_DN1880_c0_g1~~TRINITY_DN1880_c0_g1_i2.p1  ORF type:complete len:144 (+),score=27.95 TRINITY_DN1880_c0_g1_i2:109-540(+)
MDLSSVRKGNNSEDELDLAAQNEAEEPHSSQEPKKQTSYDIFSGVPPKSPPMIEQDDNTLLEYSSPFLLREEMNKEEERTSQSTVIQTDKLNKISNSSNIWILFLKLRKFYSIHNPLSLWSMKRRISLQFHHLRDQKRISRPH